MTYIDRMDMEYTERIREEESVAQDMMFDEIQTSVKELSELFPKSFINNCGELILVPKTNLYFRVKDLQSVHDLRCKIVAWCSRDACKSEPFYHTKRNEEYQRFVRDNINTFLGTTFSQEEWLLIYTYLGNGCHEDLCKAFVGSDYDLNLIKAYEEGRYGKV